MNRKLVIGGLVFLGGVVVVIGLAYGLVHALNDNNDEEEGGKTDQWKGPPVCCSKLTVTGTVDQKEFYQEMMGDYSIYEDYPELDFSQESVVKHLSAKNKFPVYRHVMYGNEPGAPGTKNAFLYFYYNTEPRKEESECPQGCWILSAYDMTPNNFWYGRKWYYMKNKADLCPGGLNEDGSKWTNQDGALDAGLVIKCAES